MKKILILILFFYTTQTFSQTPNLFNYQGVLRNTEGIPLINKNVSLRFSIMEDNESETLVYEEEHFVTTNGMGLINIEIGNGNPTSGKFETIKWGKSGFLLKVELDKNGGTLFKELGKSKLKSVPYALFANETNIKTGKFLEYKDKVIYNKGDLDSINEIQKLKLVKDTLFLSKANYVLLNGVSNSDFVYNLQNINEIRGNTNLTVNDAIITQGYSTPKDDGGAYYIVETNELGSSNEKQDNGGDIIRVNDTLIASLVPYTEVNIKQFGANGDNNNNVDDYLNIQNAIDYCQRNKISTLKIPSGKYLTSKTLVIKNLKNGTSHVDNRTSGLYLVGEGDNTTKITSTSSHTGPMIEIQGLATNPVYNEAGEQIGVIGISGSYIKGGGLKGIYFDGNNKGNATNHGLQYVAWWAATIENCTFVNFKGDGVRQITDSTVDSNPDFTVSDRTKFKGVLISRCEGYGFNNNKIKGVIVSKLEGQGSPGAIFEQCKIGICKKGGFYIQSSSFRIINSSIWANGWSNESGGENPDKAYGIYFGGNSVTFNARIVIEGCEFDNNKDAHIAISYLSNTRIANNRFIHELRNSNDIKPSNTSIIFAPDLNDTRESIRNVEFSNNFFRVGASIDYKGGEILDLTLFDWITTTNIYNIYINNNSIVNNKVNGIYHANITTFKNYDENNAHIKQNYVIDNRGVYWRSNDSQFEENRNIVSLGKPAPYYIGSLTASDYNQNNQLQVLKFNNNFHNFDFIDDLFPLNGFEKLDYDKTTGIYTCPYTGFYNINCFVTVRNLGINERARLHLKWKKYNSNISYIIQYEYAWGNDRTRTNLDLNTKLFLHKGDKIWFELGADGGLEVEPNSNYNRLHIQMVN